MFEGKSAFDLEFDPQVNRNAQWDRNGIVVVGRDPLVNSFFHLNQPSAIDIDDDGTMFIADTGNHRILAWRIDTNRGEVIAGGNGKGARIDQLDTPVAILIDRINSCLIISEIGNRRISRWSFQQKLPVGEVIISNIVSWGLAIDDEGCLYVSDSERHEVRCYSSRDPIRTGKIVAGGNGQGAGLDQLNDPRYICVDDSRSIYISDSNNHRVVKWMKNKKNVVVIFGGQGERANVDSSKHPKGVFVDSIGSVYIADQLNRRILFLTGNWTHTSNIAGELDVQKSSPMSQPVIRNANDRAIPQNPKVPLNQSKVLGSVTLDLKGNLYVVCSDVNCVMQFPIK